MEAFLRRLSILLVLLALVPGCSGRPDKAAPPPAKKAERISLRIGLIPEQYIFKSGVPVRQVGGTGKERRGSLSFCDGYRVGPSEYRIFNGGGIYTIRAGWRATRCQRI